MYDLFVSTLQSDFLLRGISMFIFGTIIGSFLNVVVYRLPLMLKHKWYKECSNLLGDKSIVLSDEVPVNLFSPSSHCPKCKAKIPVWANVPIVGYFFLKGKCFSCNTIIPVRYPLVELITGLLFALAAYVSSDIILLPGLLIFISYIICLVLIDYDTFILPDELTLSLMWIGILINLNGLIAGSLTKSVLGAVAGYMLLWSIYWIFKLITGRDGMGYGDFKFLAAILAWIGYQGLIPITLVSSALGIVYFIILRFYPKGKVTSNILSHEIPFGPFLGIAGILFIFADRYFVLPW